MLLTNGRQEGENILGALNELVGKTIHPEKERMLQQREREATGEWRWGRVQEVDCQNWDCQVREFK